MNLKITDINNGDIVTVKSGFSFGPVEVGTVVDVEQIIRVDHTTYCASKS